MILILLLKATLLAVLPLACLPLMPRASSALRHLICAMTLGGVLLLPLTSSIGARGIPIAAPPIFFRAVAVAGAATQGSALNFAALLFALWALGATILLARIAFGYREISKIIRAAENGPEYSLADVPVPMVSGLLHPCVLLPRAAASWSPERRIAALRHERAHVARKDLWINLMAHIACAVYWFHPLMWSVARHMRREQEAACDDAVLHAGFEPALYAEALIATARQFTSTSLIGCHMLTQKTLKARIARLLDNSLPRMSSTAAFCRTAAIFVVAFAGIALVNAQNGQPYHVGGGVSAAHVLYKTDPAYTEAARAAKIEGAVLLTVVIGTDGLAHDINVLKGLDGGLDAQAVEAVQKWHFEPGTLNGNPVAVQASIEINFKLL